MLFLENYGGTYDELGGEEAEEGCCDHQECEDSRSLLICRRWYSLFFMTTEPLSNAGFVVRDRLGRFYPGKDIETCMAHAYLNRTKSGFYVCKTMFKIPDDVELLCQEDIVLLERYCTPDGQAKPIILRQSCCREKAIVAERCILNFLSKDGVGSGPGGKVMRSAKDELEELAESIEDIIRGSCDRI